MGIVRAVFDATLEQVDFIREHVENAEDFKASLWDYDLGRISRYCDIPVDDFADAASALARSPGDGCITGCGHSSADQT